MPQSVGLKVKLDKDTLFLIVKQGKRMHLYEHVNHGVLREVSAGESIVELRRNMQPYERDDLQKWLRSLIENGD